MNVEAVAETQYGLVTRAQAAGIVSTHAIDRRLRSGRWVPVYPNVYRVAGAPVTWRQEALATTMWAGDNSVVSHLVAGRLLQLGLPTPSWIDVALNRHTSLSAAGVVVHEFELGRGERVTVDGIPCTSATRTLIDCASLVHAETLEAAFEQARRIGLTSVRAVEQRLARGRAGSAVMRDVLRHVQTRAKESRLEVKLARLLRNTQLREPIAQYWIGHYRVDYAWLRERVICECDGFEWHGNRLRWKRDRKRVAAIESRNWHMVHATWDDVTQRPAETLDRLAFALRRAA